MRKLIALVLLVMFVSTGHKVEAQVLPIWIGTAPCGVPLYTYQTGEGGQSRIYNGVPSIFIDPSVQHGDPRIREFTIYHECGHHVHGDLLPQGIYMSTFMRPQQELNADCYAAQHVPASFSQAMADEFRQTQGDNSPAPGYPTGNERADNILRCAGQRPQTDSARNPQATSDSANDVVPADWSSQAPSYQPIPTGPSADSANDIEPGDWR